MIYYLYQIKVYTGRIVIQPTDFYGFFFIYLSAIRIHSFLWMTEEIETMYFRVGTSIWKCLVWLRNPEL